MARNRQRAKERKEKLRRDNVPGGLDHASADVDEAEASIVAGADGEVYESDDRTLEAEALDAGPPVSPPPSEPVAASGDGDNGGEPPGSDDVAASGGSAPLQQKGLARLFAFFRACWSELQRVRWPDRRQVGQGTAVVLGFVVLAGLFLGLADEVSKQIVEVII